jgi:hypothetical protein
MKQYDHPRCVFESTQGEVSIDFWEYQQNYYLRVLHEESQQRSCFILNRGLSESRFNQFVGMFANYDMGISYCRTSVEVAQEIPFSVLSESGRGDTSWSFRHTHGTLSCDGSVVTIITRNGGVSQTLTTDSLAVMKAATFLAETKGYPEGEKYLRHYSIPIAPVGRDTQVKGNFLSSLNEGVDQESVTSAWLSALTKEFSGKTFPFLGNFEDRDMVLKTRPYYYWVEVDGTFKILVDTDSKNPNTIILTLFVDDFGISASTPGEKPTEQSTVVIDLISQQMKLLSISLQQYPLIAKLLRVARMKNTVWEFEENRNIKFAGNMEAYLEVNMERVKSLP